MKFLIIMKPRPLEAPTETRIQMIEEARAWIKQRQAAGEIEEAYSFENGGGMVTTYLESNSALQMALWTFPLAPLIQSEVYVLMDADKGFELELENLRKRDRQHRCELS